MPVTRTFHSDWRNLRTTPGGDAQSWSSTIPPGGNRTLNGSDEQEYYSDTSVGVNPFSVDSGGILSITAAPCDPASNPLGKSYTSGALTTIGLYSQTFGVFSARIACPGGLGWRPAFWMLPSSLLYSAELDVMEQWQGDDSHVHETLHGMFTAGWQTPNATPDVLDVTQMHDYRVRWTAKQCVFDIDGKVTATLPTPASMQGPMFAILNLGVGAPGSWCGCPAAGATGVMRVEWVRAGQ